MTVATANFAGQALSDTAPITSEPDSFEWCGGLYTYSDLAEALSLMCVSDPPVSVVSRTHQHSRGPYDSNFRPNLTSDAFPVAQNTLEQPPVCSASHSSNSPVSPLVPQASGDAYDKRSCEGQLRTDQHLQNSSISLSEQFCDPWMPDSWELLTKDAQELLNGLAAPTYFLWVSSPIHCTVYVCILCSMCLLCISRSDPTQLSLCYRAVQRHQTAVPNSTRSILCVSVFPG